MIHRITLVSLLVFVLFPRVILATDCAPGDIRLYTQADVDNFQANHGPNCDTVVGELYIGSEDVFDAVSDIGNLDGLAGLKAIHGGLVVEWNPLLTGLGGLENVNTIETLLSIEANEALTSLNGLASLSHLSGGVRLESLPELTDLGPLIFDNERIEFLSINYCRKITSLAPLSNHESIDFYLALEGTGLENLDDLSNVTGFGSLVFLAFNDDLANIDGLGSVVSVEGDLYFYENRALENLDGLAALEHVGGDFWISDSHSFENIDGLASLTSIGESLYITNSPNIRDLNSLGGLTHVGESIVLLGFDGMSELSGFNAITSLPGGLSIAGNQGLTRINGFNSLEQVGNSLSIRSNWDLETIEAFDGLASVGGLYLDRNALITNLDFLSALETVEGAVVIESNESLENLDGLAGISSIGASVSVIDNPLVTNVGWLSGFQAINGDLALEENAALSDLGGLGSLVSIDGDLSIKSSDSLESLDGLSGLVSIKGALVLENNDALSSTQGLGSLAVLEGHVRIGDHAALADIDALDSFAQLQSLEIFGNSMLADLGSLTNLRHIEQDLVLSANPQLASLAGLNGLESIGGSLRLRENPSLTSLGALSSLDSIGGFVEIWDNDEVASLAGLGGLGDVAGGIVLFGNNKLANIGALSGIDRLGESIASNCAVLPSSENYHNPDCIGLHIAENSQLNNLSGLDNLLAVHGHVVIEDNPSLSQCQSISRLVDVFDNAAFGPGPGVTGLIPDVNGFVSIEHNHSSCLEIPLVTEVTPEYCQPDSIDLWRGVDAREFQSWFRSDPDITCTKVVGALQIRPMFETGVDNLNDLTFVGGDLVIGSSRDLENVAGLSRISSVGGDLLVANNWALSSLKGLSGVKSIGGDLRVLNSRGLEEIGGLHALNFVGGGVEIVDNPDLVDCNSLEVLLDGRDDGAQGPGQPPIPDVGGSIAFGENADGCNSVEDIAPLPSLASAIVGSWFDPDRNGTGFMLHGVSDELAVAYYYGFDNEGARFWLIGVHQGAINWEQPVAFDATYVSGGSFGDFDPGDVQENAWGQMLLSMPNCNNGTITMTGAFAGSEASQSLETAVVRLAPTAGFECFGPFSQQPTDGLSGSWYDPSTSGQGFAVHKIDPLTGVVYFYGFDHAGLPLWLIGVWDGQLNFGSELNLQMNQVTGGTFEVVDPGQIEETPWGTLRLRFDSCDSAWAELDGQDGVHEFDLSLLAGSAGIECSD